MPLTCATLLLISWIFILRIKQPTRLTDALILLPCLTLIGVELAEYYHATDRSANMFLMLCFLGIPLFLVSVPSLVVSLAVSFSGWLYVTLTFKDASWFNGFYAHVPAALVGVTMNRMRYRLHSRLFLARRNERHQGEALQKAMSDLLESDRRFQQFADISDQVLWINQWDPTHVLYVNPAYERLTGRSIESLKKDPNDWLNSIHPADRAAVDHAYQRTVETSGFDEEYRIIRPDESIRWVRDVGKALPDANGVITSAAGIVTDITERRSVEDALRSSQVQLYNLMAELDGIVWEADIETIEFSFVSGRAEAILGYPLKEWTSKPGFWLSIIHPDDRDRTVQYCSLCVEQQRDHEFEYRCIAADGRVVWIHDKVRLVREEDGSIVRLRGIMFDITASKTADQKLLASEERFRHIFEHSPDAIFVESVEGVVLDVNEAACQLHQQSRKELVGIHISELVPDDQAEHVNREFPKFVAGEIRFFEGWSQPTTGAPVPVEIRSSHIEFEGEPALLLHVRDISERLRAEKERQQLAEQIRQMQKLEAVGTLASGVAHDFNNLLTAIQGFIDLARRGTPTDHPILAQLDMIEKAAEQGAGVTRSLLTFAQKLPTSKKPVDLHVITNETVRLLHRLMPATIDLHDVCIDRPVWVNADANQMQQILMNLAINSRDAMPNGGELTVTLEDVTAEDGNLFAQLTVTDTGQGMSDAVRQRIFEPFFSTKPREQGTGLGLAIIHGILIDHQSTIEVESAPDKGTTITVNLPCCPEPEPEYELWQDRHPSHAGLHLLLAEDNEYVRAIMNTTLSGEGFRVTAVSDGEQLLAQFDKHREQLAAVILDLDLPKVSGEDCITAIHEANADVPIIICTANAHRLLDSPQSDSANAESQTILTKPFPMSELVQVVNKAIATQSIP